MAVSCVYSSLCTDNRNHVHGVTMCTACRLAIIMLGHRRRYNVSHARTKHSGSISLLWLWTAWKQSEHAVWVCEYMCYLYQWWEWPGWSPAFVYVSILTNNIHFVSCSWVHARSRRTEHEQIRLSIWWHSYRPCYLLGSSNSWSSHWLTWVRIVWCTAIIVVGQGSVTDDEEWWEMMHVPEWCNTNFLVWACHSMDPTHSTYTGWIVIYYTSRCVTNKTAMSMIQKYCN